MRPDIFRTFIFRTTSHLKVSSNTITPIDNSLSIVNFNGEKAFIILGNNYNTIIDNVEFTIDEFGSNTCTLNLSRRLDFDVEAGSLIQISLYGKPIWVGTIYEGYDINNIEDLKIQAKGLIFLLKNVGIQKTYFAGTKIVDIIKDIVENYVVPEYPIISYNSNNFTTIPTSQIPINFQIDQKDAYTIINTLAKVINCRFFIDADRNAKLVHPDDFEQWTIFSQFYETSLKLDYDQIYNHIYVKRQSPRGTGETGWTIPAGIPVTNQTSVKKYGIKLKEFFVPEYLSDANCVEIANNLLSEFSEPKYKGEAKDLPIPKKRLWNYGRYKIISNLDYFYYTVSENDNITQIQFNSTDTTASEQISTTDFVSGAGSLRIFNIQANSTKLYYYIMNSLLYVDTIYAYLKLKDLLNEKRTFQLKLWYGESSILENFINVIITSYNFQLFSFKLPSLSRIKYIGFQLDDTKTDMEIFIDKVYVKYKGNLHLNLLAKKIKYKVDNDSMTTDITFEREEARIENYVKAMLGEGQLIKYLLERR